MASKICVPQRRPVASHHIALLASLFLIALTSFAGAESGQKRNKQAGTIRLESRTIQEAYVSSEARDFSSFDPNDVDACLKRPDLLGAINLPITDGETLACGSAFEGAQASSLGEFGISYNEDPSGIVTLETFARLETSASSIGNAGSQADGVFLLNVVFNIGAEDKQGSTKAQAPASMTFTVEQETGGGLIVTPFAQVDLTGPSGLIFRRSSNPGASTNPFPESPLDLEAGQYSLLLHIEAKSLGDSSDSASARFRATITPADVPQTGACCLPDGSCDSLTEADCASALGTFGGIGSSCEDVTCDCELSWAAPVSGAFETAASWFPPQLPQDDGAGCNDLVLNQPGSYEITCGIGAQTDSLTVQQGQPRLLGGTLTLHGFDDPALSVSGAASLALGSGELQADSVLVRGESPVLKLEPGATLTVVTSLEAGRAIGESGQLDVGGSEPHTSLSVVGDMTLAGAGNALFTGQGPLQLDVLGDLSMAVFPGSNGGMTLGPLSDEPAGPVDFVVGGTWTVGGAGEAAVTLSGPVTGSVDSVRLGNEESGVGVLNLLEGATLEVTQDAQIGIAGTGMFTLASGGNLSATNLTVDGVVDGELSALRLSGESGDVSTTVDIALDLVVGNTTDGDWSMDGNTKLDASIITLGMQEGARGSAVFTGSSAIDEGNPLVVKLSAAAAMIVGQRGSGTARRRHHDRCLHTGRGPRWLR